MTERKKLRVLGHGRVSTRGQFLKGTSTKDQKASVKKECKAKGWEYVGFISDDGIKFLGGTIPKHCWQCCVAKRPKML